MISEIAFAPDEDAGVLQCIDVNARTGDVAVGTTDCYKVDIIFTVRVHLTGMCRGIRGLVYSGVPATSVAHQKQGSVNSWPTNSESDARTRFRLVALL